MSRMCSACSWSRPCFALEGAECIPLGTQMPLLEISRAAEAHAADVVALSFSVAFPQRQIGGLVSHLRQTLAPETALDRRWRAYAGWRCARKTGSRCCRNCRMPPAPAAMAKRASLNAGFRGNKAALPSKPCQACGRPMSWRRKWAANWDSVL